MEHFRILTKAGYYLDNSTSVLIYFLFYKNNTTQIKHSYIIYFDTMTLNCKFKNVDIPSISFNILFYLTFCI